MSGGEEAVQPVHWHVRTSSPLAAALHQGHGRLYTAPYICTGVGVMKMAVDKPTMMKRPSKAALASRLNWSSPVAVGSDLYG